jgi:glycosyltransferase involved in cell wall biosynthesis
MLRFGFRGIHGVAFTAIEQAEAYHGALPTEVRVFEVLEASTNFTPGDQAEARVSTGLYGDPCLLWVGRLNALKDPLVAIEAVRLTAQTAPGLQMWCCFSDSELIDVVRSRVAADPLLASRVHLLGRVPHQRVELLLRAADLFISSSRQEGSGFALIEALACGTTPVVSDIPSFRAITGRGRVGRLAATGDPGAFAASLLDLAHKPREELRLRAIQHFRERLTFEVIGRQLRSAYAALKG